MGFIVKCTCCGQEQIFNENDSNLGDNIEIQPACWGGTLSLEIECKNPKCKESIGFQTT